MPRHLSAVHRRGPSRRQKARVNPPTQAGQPTCRKYEEGSCLGDSLIYASQVPDSDEEIVAYPLVGLEEELLTRLAAGFRVYVYPGEGAPCLARNFDRSHVCEDPVLANGKQKQACWGLRVDGKGLTLLGPTIFALPKSTGATTAYGSFESYDVIESSKCGFRVAHPRARAEPASKARRYGLRTWWYNADDCRKERAIDLIWHQRLVVRLSELKALRQPVSPSR